ncbi:metallo-beta-lactamase superfamily protein [Aspergillus brunneoviolaceus CBS 621.78]|uniref:Metallo-beta-lactamase superfamily protein n=1 Tax=Aspergillus brunneoviolaceus CBS 621.78 TaxID=1450534 RepID=A0ACD1FS07_9EURO|nr:metallo-beta-lactamase superfamily protein [Aspergillus brunneoviolaceus CBS 621.78]RAH39762.1 metallo-beta-lactamase superfamily protein [Aspergillus brunneoviolaceus CBS 621.78]
MGSHQCFPTKPARKGGYRQINKALNINAFEDYLEAQISRLPALADVEQLSPRVWRILGQNPGPFTLQGTNTYLVGTGRRRLLIDTGQGIPEWANLIAETLRTTGARLSSVLLTHWHGDHTGGVPDLLRLYPDDLVDEFYKHTPGQALQPISDGQVFQVEGATVRAVHAPGHSHDHTCFILEEEHAMFTGDNILGHGTAAVEELGPWMASLRTMQSHGCTTGYPAHGAPIRNLPGKIAAELASKLRREDQVLAALDQVARGSGGPCSVTVQQLVTVMHGDGLDPGVRQTAVEPFMEEVLRKLAADGRVAFRLRQGVKRWYGVPVH